MKAPQLLIAASCALAFSAGARAEVAQSDPSGFLVTQRIIVKADAPKSYQALLDSEDEAARK